MDSSTTLIEGKLNTGCSVAVAAFLNDQGVAPGPKKRNKEPEEEESVSKSSGGRRRGIIEREESTPERVIFFKK